MIDLDGKLVLMLDLRKSGEMLLGMSWFRITQKAKELKNLGVCRCIETLGPQMAFVSDSERTLVWDHLLCVKDKLVLC